MIDGTHTEFVIEASVLKGVWFAAQPEFFKFGTHKEFFVNGTKSLDTARSWKKMLKDRYPKYKWRVVRRTLRQVTTDAES